MVLGGLRPGLHMGLGRSGPSKVYIDVIVPSLMPEVDLRFGQKQNRSAGQGPILPTVD